MLRQIIITLALASAACSFERSKSEDPPNTSESIETVGFDLVQSEVFAVGQCLNCHSASSAAGGVQLQDYLVVIQQNGLVVSGQPENSRLYQALVTGRMPPSGSLSTERIEIVKRWINAGAHAESSNIPTGGLQ